MSRNGTQFFQEKKVVGVENISDNSEDYDQIDDLPPFSVDVDPNILLSKEDTPYLLRDHAQGTFVKRKIINVPVDNDNKQQFYISYILYFLIQ